MGEEVAVDALGVGDDDHFSSVGGVDLAVDEAACLEPVDHTGDGTGGEASELGEPSCRSRPVEQQEAERPEVCRVHAEVLGRLIARDEQLDDEVAQVQLQLANGLVATRLFWLSGHSILVC